MEKKMRYDFSPVKLANIEAFVTHCWQECRKMGTYPFAGHVSWCSLSRRYFNTIKFM